MTDDRRTTPPLGLVALALLAVGFSLRTLMASLPPLESAIKAELCLGAVAIGVLTTLPVLCMGLLAPVGARLGHRFGATRVVTAATGLIAAGNLLRGLGSATWPLFVGTFIAGAGIALAGALMPGLVKSLFPPQRAGLATGLSMFAMMGGASVASAVSVPLASALGGWPASLATWGAAAVVGLVLWLPLDRAVHRDRVRDSRPADVSHALPWRSATALLVAAYLTFQSWQFYSSLAWLSPTYVDLGWTPTASGLLLSVFSAAQLLAGLLAPALTDRVHDWRLVLLLACAAAGVGELGVWLAPTAAPWIWSIVLGLGQGAAFAVGLVLLVRYAVSPAASARLTALSFLASYTIAAFGPTAMGALRESTGRPEPMWGVLAAVMVPQVICSVLLSPARPKVE